MTSGLNNSFQIKQTNLKFKTLKPITSEDNTIDPKILEPYIPIPGRVPRKVAIDRKKKEFQSFLIEDLLVHENLDFNEKNKYCDWLELHLFDDTTFDDYSPQEWMQKRFEEEGKSKIIKGKGLFKDSIGFLTWKECEILNFDPQINQFEVQWSHNQQNQFLYRIYICFDAEDPRKFSKRITHAFQQRIYADSVIRYNHYIDNMPLHDLNELDQEQKKRLENLAKNKRIEQMEATELLIEINNDYCRTMNKIIFDKYLQEQNCKTDDLYPNHLNLPEKPKPKEVPYLGIVPLEKHQGKKLMWIETYGKPVYEEPKEFTEIFKDFCFSSLYIKEEVIQALQQIRVECNKIVDMKMFNIEYYHENNRPLILEEFKHIQDSCNSQLLYCLKGQWVFDLIRIIKNNLDKVGKGWFNMNDVNSNTYRFGKLKRFLTLVRLMMQDTIEIIVKRSFNEMEKYLLEFLPNKVEIKSITDINNIYENPNAKKQPLFVIDLIKNQQNDEDLSYSINPLNYVNMVINLFEKSLEEIGKIPDLEPKILPHLYASAQKEIYIKAPQKPKERPKTPDPNLKPRKFADENKWIWELIESLKAKLIQSLQPLKKYLEAFSELKEIQKINPDEFVKNIEMMENPWETEQIVEEIKKNEDNEQKLKQSLPEKIHVSYFEVQTKEILGYLCDKYYTLRKNLIELLARRTKRQNLKIFNTYQIIQSKIKVVPKNIEQLTEIREYIKNLPIEIEKLKLEQLRNNDNYKIIENFNYRFSKEDLDKKWNVFAFPRDLNALIEQREKEFDKYQKNFEEETRVAQEEFKDLMENLERTIGNFDQYQELKQHEEIANIARDVSKCLNELIETARQFNQREALYGKEMTNYEKLNIMQKEFQPYSNLWITVNNWIVNKEIYLYSEWNTLDAVTAEKFVDESIRILTGVIRFLRERGIQNVLQIAQFIKQQLDEFKPKVPLMVALRKKGMMERHWKCISDKVGKEIKYASQGFCFSKVLELNLLEHIEFIVEVGERAFKEYNIQVSLEEMQKIWEGINFKMIPYKNNYIIKGYDEIQITLDEHIMNTQAMQFSPFKKPFENEIVEWNNKLKTISDVLEEWAKFQSQWMYLQPIFDSQDIAKQLPAETKKFRTVDSTWKHTMNQAYNIQNVLMVCTQENLVDRLLEANKNLEIIQKELSNYLEKKREKFARFYFLSNDDLLEILSQTKEPTAVQPHLKKVFENINEIQFDSHKKITAMFSSEKEKIPFVKMIDPNNKNVEDWMSEVENAMCLSIRAALLQSVQKFSSKSRDQWVLQHPGQCILNGSQIIWTGDVENALIEENGIKDYFLKLESYLNDLVNLVRQKNISKQSKVTLNALIVLDVHAKDIVEKLCKNNIKSPTEFEWISQLRYYWEEDNCKVKCIQTNFPYGYEYLGNTLRLVITPLTDKCYMTLMGALKLNLGGAPAGPAGTGKTESTKDLAKALAKQCVVFNCSDSMDYIMVGKFFKGLSSAGAWCCFDEFNRINIEVLSVIAQQLLILFGEKAKGTPSIEFEGSVIKILPTFCVFITMNPGYAGRTELPDNLKALFRPVAMMVPDYAMIGEIMLYSFGFTKGRELAKKMVATFKLCSEQLSSQDHYDYGMRAVRSVINAAGLLKANDVNMDEQQLLLRALRDVNVPKFLKNDLPLFENIMMDLFPGVEKPAVNYGNLIPQIKKVCTSFKLQPVDSFVNKIIQLYDTTQVRHGLMIVGPSGGGKTCNYKVLQKAMSDLEKEGFSKVNVHIVNPKSINLGQLYGEFNEQTHEWTDGILAYTVRECCRDQSSDKHWVMFDGPVDAVWIESMNTVLDDNKKLCLNSGQILTLSQHMTMMFEVEDLVVASPATVSRCGMIYMEPESLGYQPLIDSWLQSLPANIIGFRNVNSQLKELCQNYIGLSLDFLRKNLKELVASINNNLVGSLIKIMNTFLYQFQDKEIKKTSLEDLDLMEKSIVSLFLFSLTWSIGCTTDNMGRNLFNNFLKEQIQKFNPKLKFPEEETIYDYEYNIKEGQYTHWDKKNEEFKVNSKLMYHEVMIPTTDSTRNIFLIKTLIQNGFHTLTLGPTGTGKSLTILNLLTSEIGENYQYISMAFSAQTTANQTQDTIDNKLDKRRKGVYGPPIGKKCIIFVDDLNMPKKEEYGAQPPIELLRQFLDHQGWYNIKELQFKKLEDLILLTTMGPPGGGRTFITNRIMRHFNILAYTELDEKTIVTIFSKLSEFFLRRHNEEVQMLIPYVVENVIQTYNCVKADLLPTPQKSHYTFNLRDIWRVFQGLCSTHPKCISSNTQMVRLWYHESLRVFHDRLINEKDRDYLVSLLQGQLTKFNIPQEEVLDTERIIFADFINGKDAEPKFYQQIKELNVFLNKLDSFQEVYNSDNTFIFGGPKQQMKLVMFLDACEHIARIARIIRQPCGNALLFGIGGSGRQSLARMATFLTNYKIFQIEVTKSYTMRTWRDDLKKVLMYTGIENKTISFLFCDTQIFKEQMMEDINNILNSGDVVGIYNDKDYEDIMNACKTECIKKNIQPTKMNIFQQYIIRIKKNIHLIIAMSPLSSQFATRLRMFPSLVNNCTIDWFSEWPEEALIGVGKGQLVDYEEELEIQGKLDLFVEVFKTMHKSVENISTQYLKELRRHNYVTPTSYLEVLYMFRMIMQNKKQELKLAINRLKSGLDKLQEANEQVAQMKNTLKQMQPQLEAASAETEKMMQSLKIEKAEADTTQKIVSQEEAIASKQQQEATELAIQAEESVAEANRILNQTLAEVQKLKKEHLVEIKSLGSPPQAVKVTLAGVVILNLDKIKKNGGDIIITAKDNNTGNTKKEENYFETAKRYLLNDTRELLEMLLSYDKDNIQPATIQKLEQKVLNQPEFTYSCVERCSFATKFLYMWVKAMVDYYHVFTETKPLREKLLQMRKIVEEKTAELNIKKAALDQINAKIASLQELFNEKIAQKELLTSQMNECQIKLDRAQKLTDGLVEEKERWKIDIQKLYEKSLLIPSHAALSAAMIAYSGPFTQKYRQQLELLWTQKVLEYPELPFDENIKVRNFLGVQVKIQQWNINGLPKDDTSTENGIIIDKTRRWPLMIDPQGQANKFIRNNGRENPEGIEIIKATDHNLMKIMELSIQFGRWVLLENVGIELDQSLEPILMQQTIKSGSTLMINIGDKTLQYSDNFKLFLTTTMPNPHYPPETFVKVTVINFAITPSGLEEQMLAQIVALENPSLEQRKIEIVKKNAIDQKELLRLEDSILKVLADTQDIAEFLKDETLINQLSSSKKFATEINQRVKESIIYESQIDKARESYRPVAFRASLLFFCIVDLSTIDPMYQYSLQWFTNLFVMAVENSPTSTIHEERLDNLNSYFTYSLYENVCRSLFERHKLLFSLMLCAKILFGENKLDENEWRYFLTGPTADINIPSNPSNWISDNMWPDIFRNFNGMAQLCAFQNIDKELVQNPDQFKYIFDSQNPQDELLPHNYEQTLNLFQKIIVLKSIRPDKLIPAIQKFIEQNMGKKFIIVPTFDLSKCYKDSTITTPLIFVLSTGSDPIADFMKFAEEMSMQKRIDSISLGQGQGPKAEKLIKESTQKGGWVLLQNCHLAQSWMSDLERLCEELNDKLHKDFRLWLTSMPANYFPISVLQNSIKMTMEPPQGLRANLLRSYKNMSDQELNDCRVPDIYKKLLFGFCLFHAIVQDRRKFGPIGWNIPYEFTNEDLSVCKKQLKMLLDEYKDVPYKVINFLGAEINYGGRVTDDKDVRLMKTLLANYINKESIRNNYKYSESGMYISPQPGTLEEYITYIESLPLNPAPEAFGLHENAEITNSQNEARVLLETILSVQPRSAGNNDGKSREEIILDIANHLQKNIPDIFDVESVSVKYPTSYTESMNTVLVQELIRYNRMLVIIKQSLVNLKKGLKGLVVLSEDLEKIMNSLYDNQVPQLWSEKGFLSLKPLSSWTQDLNERIEFLNQWIKNGTPCIFWISGFFFPQAFITGTVQNYARKHQIAIDKLSFDYLVLDQLKTSQITQKPDDGCYVYGIFLEGAKWDYKKHILQQPQAKELYSDLPIMQLLPIPDRESSKDGIYNCPMYKVVSRRGTLSTTGHSTNFVMEIELPSKEPESTWIKAGVACFLSLRY